MVFKLDPEKESKVIAMLKDSAAHTDAEIGRAADVAPATVKKIKARIDVQLNGDFFEQRLKGKSAKDMMMICKDPSYDPSPATTKVHGDTELPEISQHLLKKHRVDSVLSSALDPKLKQRLVKQFEGGSGDFHGFWIHRRNDDYDKVLVDKFLERMEDPKFMAHFTPIFEYTQKVEGHAFKKQKTDQVTWEEMRFGDKGRMHWRFNELTAELEKQLVESDAEIKRLRITLRDAQAKLDAFSKACLQGTAKSTRGTPDIANANAVRMAEFLKLRDDTQKELEDAQKADATLLEDSTLALKVGGILCDNYTRIMEHSPYAKLKVECTINDLRLLSIILAKPDAASQTMHADSRQQGCSHLMSTRKRQYLIVLLNSFKAMRSLDRMLLKRKEALQFVHDMLTADPPDGWVDSNWDAQAEIRVWNYLCNLQFEHEGIGAIKAVRVPIDEGETLVVDNRTLHGGSPTPGEKTVGFRFHAYGYVRDVRKRARGAEDRYEKDEDVTIDPLDVKDGFYPLCRWAQKSAPPVFRA